MPRTLTTRALPAGLVAVLLLLVTALPAWAHAGFDVREVPASGSLDVELRVPIEIEAGNEFVDVLAPAGWTVDACTPPAGWDCSSEVRDDGATVVNIERTADGDPATELFALSMTAPAEQGSYAFPVVQTYDDGTEAAWIGEPGGDRPAPVIQVGDDATPVERSSELPSHAEDDELGAAPADDESGSDAGTADDEPTEDATADEATTDDGSVTEEASAAPSEAADDDLAVDDAVAEDDGSLLPVLLVVAVVLAVVVGVVLANRRREA